MEVTEIKIRRLMNDGRLRAVVSIVLNNVFAVHEIKIIQGVNRMFVAMPSKRESDGSYKDIVHPLTAELREELESKILAAYKESLNALIEE